MSARHSSALTAAVATLLLLSLSTPSSAVPPRQYRILDLGILPGGSESQALGINNGGEVVGWSKVATTDTHAFVWLPAPILNGAFCQGMHDLHVFLTDTTSKAYDINLAREIAGEKGGSGPTSQRAVVWKLVSPAVSFCAIPPLPGGYWDFAWALNDDSPPLVVGDSDIFIAPCGQVTRGFSANVGVIGCQVTSHQELPPVSGDNVSRARSVNRPAGPLTLQIIGHSVTEAFPPLCPDGGPTPARPPKTAPDGSRVQSRSLTSGPVWAPRRAATTTATRSSAGGGTRPAPV
jgi:probable HAF family extracellular repeat protein